MKKMVLSAVALIGFTVASYGAKNVSEIKNLLSNEELCKDMAQFVTNELVKRGEIKPGLAAAVHSAIFYSNCMETTKAVGQNKLNIEVQKK